MIMKSVPLATLVLGSVLVSIATVYSTDLPARDKSSRGASVSADNATPRADRGGASARAGNTTASADRGGASARVGNTTASAERALTTSAERAGARAGAGNTTASVERGDADARAGNATARADRGGASAGAGNTTASVERGDADVGSDGGRQARAVPAASGKLVGDRSYDSVGGWFDDLRSMFSGKRKDADVVNEEVDQTTTHSSVTSMTETSDSGGTHVNRVIQRQSSTEIATEGGSASAEAEASNVSEIQQKN
jgi:hypothetical protein